mmetsp:Transcript_19279/g.33275  ORF Transcript_19279/g.33275 Transcript_19279/m.33275 type:complete len:93 (+) Transcript_19279:102-380(+)|eukprot:CAMPEP_0119105866 /NCGR_PEP_ID=MMETSP1180-20130426/3717_1 /TAXON_ID=3052 ORGANISM="Chlamydomonas cf sp, Strain CCMP681" /NCGR_SAMPLE_ID=MMETSP1180 /ASSEMBLY_ACC=CAM_ASM_000741 /LENGTH=92 /DNA_ID=CAMNT_0007091039 /DNA_START=115 /DNA_END=393 /DNA_ORIENTATION=+
MGKWFGPDVIALSLPMFVAACGFGTMIGRAFIVDPEWSNTGVEWYEKEEAADVGKFYRMQYQSTFRTMDNKPKYSYSLFGLFGLDGSDQKPT